MPEPQKDYPQTINSRYPTYEDDEYEEPTRIIYAIAGGIERGDNKNARESIARSLANSDKNGLNTTRCGINPLTFDESEAPPLCNGEGFSENPDVPLVIKARIAGCNVRKILVNTGSSANLIFSSTLENMEIEPRGVRPVVIGLKGFVR